MRIVEEVRFELSEGSVSRTSHRHKVTPGSTPTMIASDRSPADRRFKTATGQTPRAYLQRIRIQAAKRLLETTTDPVDHLRAQVGYGDPTAFRRAFTHATGLGPRQYRQKYGSRRLNT